MTHWLDKVVTLLSAETASLRELAHLAGGDPKIFYRGVDLDKLDLEGQDIEGMEFGRRSPAPDREKRAKDLADTIKEPVILKKYANRRIYNTRSGTYVTLDDLSTMTKAGEDFLVYDAKTGDDLTRSMLAQIIFEQENKAGQALLSTTFLRQLISFYGDSMQALVPKYLEQSIDTLTREQETFRKRLADTFSGTPFAPLEEHVRRNMELFQQTFLMFMPFVPSRVGKTEAETPIPASARADDNIVELRRQMKEMRERLDRMSTEPKLNREP